MKPAIRIIFWEKGQYEDRNSIDDVVEFTPYKTKGGKFDANTQYFLGQVLDAIQEGRWVILEKVNEEFDDPEIDCDEEED